MSRNDNVCFSFSCSKRNQIPSRKVPNEWFDDVDVAYDDDDANGDFHDQDKKNLASVILTAPSSEACRLHEPAHRSVVGQTAPVLRPTGFSEKMCFAAP